MGLTRVYWKWRNDIIAFTSHSPNEMLILDDSAEPNVTFSDASIHLMPNVLVKH